jgi:tRNA/tmRNA/rRNA uracil-C5-methylase (TrmA/RlmC/RlmD family)
MASRGGKATRRRVAYRDREGAPSRAAGPWLGAEFEVSVGAVAHGGHCVARHEGRVVFVRHALPGERVRVRVTEDGGGSFCRADAVAILTASPDRVEPPCPYAGPGLCGGCDWQHASAPAQLALKADVVREALQRIGGLSTVDVVVEALPGGLLGWRTRVQYAADPAGRLGLRRHRSHQVELIDHCPLGTDAVSEVDAPAVLWPGAEVVEVIAADQTAVLETPKPQGSPRHRRPPARRVAGPAHLTEHTAGRDWRVTTGGFWQVHPHAADTLSAAVLDLLAPRPGERAYDLYCGAGLFAGVLAEAVGPTGHVVAVESDPTAVADAAHNLAGQAAVHRAQVADWLPTAEPADLVVLDPPRSGAGAPVMEALCALSPRAIAYVACDPAALARDLRTATGHGYRLAALRAYDLFPMTQHIECVALLHPASQDHRGE